MLSVEEHAISCIGCGNCENKCPLDYNKLIPEKNECIDNCTKDNEYKYEFQNKCYNTSFSNVDNIFNYINNMKNSSTLLIVIDNNTDINELIFDNLLSNSKIDENTNIAFNSIPLTKYSSFAIII